MKLTQTIFMKVKFRAILDLILLRAWSLPSSWGDKQEERSYVGWLSIVKKS